MKELNNIGGIKNFTKLYSLSKTLRFKLIPVYGTKENIKKNLIPENDNQLANDYQDMKKISIIIIRNSLIKHLKIARSIVKIYTINILNFYRIL